MKNVMKVTCERLGISYSVQLLSYLWLSQEVNKLLCTHTVHPFNLQFCAEVMQEKFIGIQVIS